MIKIEKGLMDNYLNDKVRDINQCSCCGDTETEFLTPYYKDGNSNNNTVGNVLLLCPSCFSKVQLGVSMTVCRTFTIDIAHYLPGHPTCGFLHGHTVEITVGVKGYLNLSNGMVIDFGKLKNILQEVVHNKFDHRFLNHTFPIPTSEYFAFYIFNSLKKRQLDVSFVRVYETKNNYVELKAEDLEPTDLE
jgi:6-pyruvoyltetrahydropterin/6-carboxytetrahydropterin synthase